jgi:predicted nucleic acid-binding protein
VAAEVFVDTSAWYPAVVKNHPDHRRVAAALTRAVQQGKRVVTTNLVVAETHALLLRRAGAPVALAFARTVRLPPNLVVSSDPDIEAVALGEWLERFSDQDFSLTDAVSFAVMAARGIADALTLDRHFVVAGFRAGPGRRVGG